MAESKVETLSSKLSNIANEIKSVQKSGRNKEQGYAFIEYAEVAARVRELLSKYRVCIYPEVEDYERTEITSKNGKSGFHYILRMKFLIVNGDDQKDIQERHWLGEGADYGDKGINKAETSAAKYFMMRLFNVSEKGEGEADLESPEFVKPKTNEPSEKQLGYLKKLLKDAGKGEEEIADIIRQCKTAKQASAFIEKARTLTDEEK